MGLREERKQERQAAVLAAATRIIQSSGIDSVTMAAIAKDMSASIGGLYRYFPNKEAIFFALQINALKAFEQSLDEIMATKSEVSSRIETLRRLVLAFQAWTRFRITHPMAFSLLDQFLSSPSRTLDESGRVKVNEHLKRVLMKLSSTLHDAVALGVLHPGNQMARTHILWAAMHGMEHFRKRDSEQPDSTRVDVLRPQMIAALLIGWGASKGLVSTVFEELPGPI